MILFILFLQINLTSPVFAYSKNLIVIDVRTPEEFNEVRVEGSHNFDIYNSKFKEMISKLDKTKTYKVYCRSGNRSGQAEKIMKSLGFKDVENVGSISEAAKYLNRKCQGKTPC